MYWVQVWFFIINKDNRPLKLAVSGSLALASVKAPQACHGKGTAIKMTDIIQSDGWGGDKTVLVSVCVCVVGTITCSSAQFMDPAMSSTVGKHHPSVASISFFSLFFSPRWSWRDPQSDTVFSHWHMGMMRDVATSDDSNDRPPGRDLVRHWDKRETRQRQFLCKDPAAEK